MTRWELLKTAENVLKGEYGDGRMRKNLLRSDYIAVQKIVNTIIKYEDWESKEIEKHRQAIRELEKSKKDKMGNL